MKKVILSLGILLLSVSVTIAQGKKNKRDAEKSDKQQTITATTPVTTAPASSLTTENMAFKSDAHEFGTIPEGPDANYEFVFTNTGKEPIIIQKAQPSCGCTVPQFSSEPVPPGASGKISVAYHTKGRPNPFTKTISVVSNAGTKVLTIKGNVEKAPTSSVPESTSMMKTN